MNPQLNKIFSKLAKEDKKTELASEKVELGMVDDLAKQKNNADTFIKTINSGIKEIVTLDKQFAKAEEVMRKAEQAAIKRYEKLESESKKASKLISQMDKLFEKIEKASKDLGVNPKDIKGYAAWDKSYDELFRIEDEVKKYG